MAEPESHSLHLLREIREDIRRVDRKVDMLDRKVEKNIADLQEITDGLMQSVSGELAIREYIVNGGRKDLHKWRSA